MLRFQLTVKPSGVGNFFFFFECHRFVLVFLFISRTTRGLGLLYELFSLPTPRPPVVSL